MRKHLKKQGLAELAPIIGILNGAVDFVDKLAPGTTAATPRVYEVPNPPPAELSIEIVIVRDGERERVKIRSAGRPIQSDRWTFATSRVVTVEPYRIRAWLVTRNRCFAEVLCVIGTPTRPPRFRRLPLWTKPGSAPDADAARVATIGIVALRSSARAKPGHWSGGGVTGRPRLSP